MPGEKTAQGPESDSCNQDAVYIFLVIALLALTAVIVLVCYILRLRRRQNGYMVVRGHEDEVRKYKELYEEEKREKEDALQRLSKIMSDRLTDGNPNIANLADAKRPTKLAEDFSELYDDEWTGAFESIDGKEEKEKVDFLLNILQIADCWSRQHAEQQLQNIKHLFLFPWETDAKINVSEAITVDIIKSIKDGRKRLAQMTGENLSTKVYEEVKERLKGSGWEQALLQDSVEGYCRKSAQLSWFLAVQDPPMHVKFSGFSVEHVKAYTRSGKILDFVVWPPLYLHENGSLVSKGIAQFQI